MAKSAVFPAIIRPTYDPNGAFAAFAQDAERSAASAKRQFESSFSEIGDLARKALSLPRNTGGSLDLGVNEYRAAATAANAQAIALREIATAARATAAAEKDTTQTTRLYVQAADAAAIAAEAEAREIQQLAIAHERLQAELNKTASRTQQVVLQTGSGTTANRQLVNSTQAVRQATLQAGQQLQDIGISLYSGQRASVVFAQQLPQLAFALSGLEGNANKALSKIGSFASFLSGPWGLAVGLAVGVIGSLVASLFDTGEASDKAGKKVKSLTDRIEEQNEKLRENIKLQGQKNVAEVGQASKDLGSAQADLNRVAPQLEAARRALAKIDNLVPSSGAGGEALRGQQFAARARVDALEKELKRLEGLAATASESIRIGQSLIIDRRIAGQLDPLVKETNRYEDALGKLKDQQRTGAISNDEYAASSKKLLAVHKANVAALQEEKKALNAANSDVPKYKQLRDAILDEFPGARITSTTGGRHVAGSHHYQARAIDFVPAGGVGSITKAQIRKAIEARGGEIDELLGPGDKGHSDHFHISLKKGSDALRVFADNQRDATREATELDRALEFVQSRFGKIDDAASDYADALAKISTLEKAGAINSEQASKYRIQAALQRYDREQAKFEADTRETFSRLSPAWQEALTRPLEPSGDVQQMLDDIMRRSAEVLGTEISRNGERGLDAIARSFGGKTARFLNDLSRGEDGDGVTRAINAFGDSLDKANRALIKSLNGLFNDVFGKNGAALASSLGAVLASVQLGQGASSIAKSLGLKQSKLGSQIGGGIGGALGGPIGAIVGGFIGGTIGGFFRKTPKGSTTLNGFSGDLSYSGSGKLKDSVLSFGDSVRGTLSNIIESLNGTAGSFAVSVGQRGKKFTVDPTGQGRTKGSGVQKFATQEEAARAALLDAINDGAVQGIRQGAQNLLRAGKDVEAALAKAVKFQSVFDRLKAIEDPVGAALDTLDREFTNLKSIFAEAGASAEEYAQLEKLYGIERVEAIKQADEAIKSSLKALYSDLTVGDNGKSLRDRLAAASEVYNPLAARVRAGDTTAFNDFSDAGRTMLDLIRQIEGSGEGYFRFLDELTAITKGALDGTTSDSANRPGIFSTPANSTVPVVDAIGTLNILINGQLTAVNDNLGSLINLFAVNGRAGGIGVQLGINNF